MDNPALVQKLIKMVADMAVRQNAYSEATHSLTRIMERVGLDNISLEDRQILHYELANLSSLSHGDAAKQAAYDHIEPAFREIYPAVRQIVGSLSLADRVKLAGLASDEEKRASLGQ